MFNVDFDKGDYIDITVPSNLNYGSYYIYIEFDYLYKGVLYTNTESGGMSLRIEDGSLILYVYGYGYPFKTIYFENSQINQLELTIDKNGLNVIINGIVKLNNKSCTSLRTGLNRYCVGAEPNKTGLDPQPYPTKGVIFKYIFKINDIVIIDTVNGVVNSELTWRKNPDIFTNIFCLYSNESYYTIENDNIIVSSDIRSMNFISDLLRIVQSPDFQYYNFKIIKNIKKMISKK